jgi:hypothetical protein
MFLHFQSIYFLHFLVDQLNCTVLLDKNMGVFQERETEKKIGTEVKRDGLWYVNRDDVLLAAAMNGGQKEVIL